MSEDTTSTETTAETTDTSTAETSAQTTGTDDWAEIFKGKSPAKVKEELSRWEGRSKGNLTKAEQAEAKAAAAEGKLESILAAIGIDTKKDEVDPKQLVADLESERTGKNSLKVENAILRTAAKAGADAEALTDSRSFMAEVSKLDPSADDFNDKIIEAVNAAVEKNQALKVAPQFARSSGTEVGGNRSEPPLTQQLADATKAGNIQLAVELRQRIAASTK